MKLRPIENVNKGSSAPWWPNFATFDGSRVVFVRGCHS